VKHLSACLLVICLNLPASATADFSLSTDSLELTFSDHGNLVSAVACYPACGSSAPGGAVKRGIFGGGAHPVVSGDLPMGGWTLTPGVDGRTRVLSFESTKGAVITWRIPRQGYQLELRIGGESTRPERLNVYSGTGFRPRQLAGFGTWLEQVRYVALPGPGSGFDGGRAGLDHEEPIEWKTDGWAGYRNRYWALMIRPDTATTFQVRAGEGRQDADLQLELGDEPRRFHLYLGPIESGVLAAADPALGGLQYGALWFWLRWICFGMLWLLGAIQAGLSTVVSPAQVWGCSIILLSLVVHILMRPLTRIADRFQDQVQATESRLAPELSRIRREQRGEAQAEQIMALYRREGVHPLYSLKSLLGVAVVIPVFIGAFDMLAENIELLGAGFLWIEDLSRPDAIAQLPFELPFFGGKFNLLPVLMTGFSVLASWLHRPPALHASLRRKQVRNMLLLAAAFFVLFYTFPSGMVLYWTTNNLISAAKGGWQHWRTGRKSEQDAAG